MMISLEADRGCRTKITVKVDGDIEKKSLNVDLLHLKLAFKNLFFTIQGCFNFQDTI